MSYSQIQKCTVAIFLLKVDSGLFYFIFKKENCENFHVFFHHFPHKTTVVAENNMHDIITVTPSRHFDLRKTCGIYEEKSLQENETFILFAGFFVDGYYGSGFIAEAQPNPTDSFTCLITANHCIDPPKFEI